MNKKVIDDLIPKAYAALKEAGVAKFIEETNVTEINKTFRGYISSFGAAIAMGSLKSAIAFYSQQNSASKEREKLIHIIYVLVKNLDVSQVNRVPQTALFDYVVEKGEAEAKENIYNAAIAVKLAMNLYKLVKGD